MSLTTLTRAPFTIVSVGPVTTNYIGEPIVKVVTSDGYEHMLLDVLCRAYGYNPLDNTLHMYGSADAYNSLAMAHGYPWRA